MRLQADICQKTSGAYRKGCYVMHYSRVIRQGRAFGMLEPYDGKLSCRVLRGLGAGNSSRLPDVYLLSTRKPSGNTPAMERQHSRMPQGRGLFDKNLDFC